MGCGSPLTNEAMPESCQPLSVSFAHVLCQWLPKAGNEYT
jgi:hypothetical protein